MGGGRWTLGSTCRLDPVIVHGLVRERALKYRPRAGATPQACTPASPACDVIKRAGKCRVDWLVWGPQ